MPTSDIPPPQGDGLPDVSHVDVEVTLAGRQDVRTPVWYVAELFVGFLRVLRAAVDDAGPKTKRALFALCLVLFHTKGRGAQRLGVKPEDVDLSALAPEAYGDGAPRECRVVVIGRPIQRKAPKSLCRRERVWARAARRPVASIERGDTLRRNALRWPGARRSLRKRMADWVTTWGLS